MLDGYGVTDVFFVPTILNRSLVELEESTQIRRIVAHSEKAAAYMADGYGRATGRPGVCMAQTVGAANLAAGLRDAALTASPIVAITGGPAGATRDRHQYQEIEDRPMFGPVTKESLRVDDVDRLPATLRRAFRAATTGRPGPVHVELAGHHGELVEDQLTAKSPAVERRHARAPAVRTPAPDRDVEHTARLIAGADRPVIVAGGGVRLSGARRHVVALAEEFSIPVATSLTGKDVIPAGHPLAVGVTGLYGRDSANTVVRQADLVVLIGTRGGSQATHSWRFPDESQTLVQIDLAPDVMGANYLNEASVFGDVRTVIGPLAEVLREIPTRERRAWLERVRHIVDEWYRAHAPMMSSDAIPLRPERLCREIADQLPDDAVLVADTGHAGMWSAGWVDLRSPDQMFLRSAGSLGWALPAGIGAQLALGDRPVVVFTGDGGLWYHLAELETAARWGVPITVIVNDNRSFNQEIIIWTDAYGGELRGRHHELWTFRSVDLAAIAREMGVEAVRVDGPAALAVALRDAFDSDGPRLVDVVTDMYALAPLVQTTP